MNQMKRQTLLNGLLSLTAVSLITGCVDDKYDLSDIDTTSRFTVKDLTVPVKLSQIKLENVVNLDDNENISTINGEYAISKGGRIEPTEFKLNKIDVNAPTVQPITITIPTDGLPGVITPLFPIPAIPLPEKMESYDFSMDNVEKALQVLQEIKTTPISIKVTLSVPTELTTAGNSLSFENLDIQLPWGLITDDSHYKKDDGMLHYPVKTSDANGNVVLELIADGLDLMDKGTVNNGYLSISGPVGVKSGNIKLDIAQSVNLPSPFEINAKFEISGFTIETFSGKINYEMDNINIAPISLNDLPDFLDSPKTNLIIANPEIGIEINNPVAQYGLVGKGKITLTSTFGNGESIPRSSDVFSIKDNNGGMCKLTLSPAPTNEATGNYQFEELGYVLTNHHPNESEADQNKPGLGLPKSISVSIEDLSFAGDVTDFPLSDLGTASGNYSFTAPLGFGNGSKVIYESTEDGWGSEDLDKVNINKIHLKAICSTNLPVSVQLSVVPIDKHGNEIAVKENSGNFEVPAYGENKEVTLSIEGVNGPIKDFDGVRFKATVEQDSGYTNAIGPDLFIDLDNLSVTVDGYYETDF